jgi:hypothetical protein
MRLPSRDLLEDVDQSVPAVLSQVPDAGARREQAVLVEVAGGPMQDGTGEGLTVSAHLGAWLDLGSAGPFGVDYVRVADGSSPGVEGTADALQFSWIAPFETPLGSIKAALSGARDERLGLVPDAGPYSSAFDGQRLHATSLLAGDDGLLALVLDAETLAGSEAALGVGLRGGQHRGAADRGDPRREADLHPRDRDSGFVDGYARESTRRGVGGSGRPRRREDGRRQEEGRHQSPGRDGGGAQAPGGR